MMDIGTLIEKSENAFYTFDIDILKKRAEYLKKMMPDNVSLCYAVKANTFIIKELEDTIGSFEICSPGEAKIYDGLGMAKEKAVVSGIYKTPSFIETLAADTEFDGIFTIESEEQYRLLDKLGRKYDRNLKVIIRLTNDSQFGVNESEIEEMIKNRFKTSRLSILGIQYFTGTQKTSVKKLKREIEYADGFIGRLKDDLGFETEIFEYGGGFPVKYFTCDEFDEEAYLKEFSDIINGMSYKGKITLELGRSIAASCGKYYSHVVDLKTNKGQNYAVTDGGMHHIVYFGQSMAMKHPFASVVGKEAAEKKNPWNICGSLCSMNDIIVKQFMLPDLEIGDTICFENTGAYCMTEVISFFLSRDIPAVYLIKNNECFCVREPSETAEFNTPKYERK